MLGCMSAQHKHSVDSRRLTSKGRKRAEELDANVVQVSERWCDKGGNADQRVGKYTAFNPYNTGSM